MPETQTHTLGTPAGAGMELPWKSPGSSSSPSLSRWDSRGSVCCPNSGHLTIHPFFAFLILISLIRKLFDQNRERFELTLWGVWISPELYPGAKTWLKPCPLPLSPLQPAAKTDLKKPQNRTQTDTLLGKTAGKQRQSRVPESRSLPFAFSVHNPAWHFPSNNCAFCLSIIHPCHCIPVVHLYL